MKAYAVVRKSPPPQNNLEHSFKMPARQQNIEISLINDNLEHSIRRYENDRNSNSVDSRLPALKNDHQKSEASKTSVSPGKKHKIFEPRVSSLSKQKAMIFDRTLQNSIKKVKQPVDMAAPLLESVTPFQSTQQQKSKNRSSAETPEKVDEESQVTSFLGGVQSKTQRNSSPFRRTHKIFDKHQVYSSVHDQKVRAGIPTEQQLNRSSEPGKLLSVPTFSRISPNKHMKINPAKNNSSNSSSESDTDGSVINIGCCGQELPVKYDFQNASHQTSKYDQRSTSKAAENIQQPCQKRIFSAVNPEMVTKGVQLFLQQQQAKEEEQMDFKVDKINARVAPGTVEVRKHRVVVFQIKSIVPFEF